MTISPFAKSKLAEASFPTPLASSPASCTHYIASDGSDSYTGTSSTQPWATFAHAIDHLGPGDTLCMVDGTYFQSLDITISGTEVDPITFIAINDGKVTVDGEFNRVACRVMDSHDVVVEGIICQRSSQSVFTVVRSERVTVRRVSAYDVKATDCNCHAFVTDRAQDVLFEDVIAGGRARTTFTLYNSRRIVVRRAYARWKEEPTSNSMGVNNLAQYYGTSGSLSENNVGTIDGPTPNSVLGWGVWNHYYNTDPIASNNSFLGNISFDLTHAGFFDSSCKWQTRDNRFIDNVSINNRFGMWQRGDDTQVLSHYTNVGGEIGYYMHENPPTGDCEPAGGLVLGSDITNSVFLTASNKAFVIHNTEIPKDLSHNYNLFWGNTGLGTTLNANETAELDPVINTEKWGNGAYLFPDPDSPRATGGQDGTYLGADVRFRYIDGELTDVPLWPWPMEERVCDELGASVTWERSDQVSAKTGQVCQGGLWKTLDRVYNASDQTFADVSPEHWAYDDIETLYQDGFIAGCSDEPLQYCPEQAMTRAESAVFVERGVHGGGYLPDQPDHPVFTDVALSAWFAKWSHRLWEDGYTSGCNTTPLSFCPLSEHTRAEATVFFLRMLKGKDYLPSEPTVQNYDDVPLGMWYSKWIDAAHREGLLQDCEDLVNRADNLFRPEQELTRAEAACMMVRAKEGQNVIHANPSNYLSLLRTLKPGDTLLLVPGTYDDPDDVPGLPFFNIHGTSDQPILVTGPEDGPRPIFLGRASHNTVRFDDASYITIRNIEIDGRDLGGDGIKAQGVSHNIILENILIRGVGSNQQIVGISTKAPAWNWIIRGNTILGAGTGIYLGNSDGTDAFVNGLIEYNTIRDTIGYNMQVKHQNIRDDVPGMPTEDRTTIIRHNVFSKANNASTEGMARPNLLVGHFPPTGHGSNDVYQIYGNFFYQNPSGEPLFQGEGNIALYNNLFVNHVGDAIWIQPHNDVPKVIRIFNNTVVASGTGIRVTGGSAEYQQKVTGNAVFAATPIQASDQADNITDQYSAASDYLVDPFNVLGTMDLYPMPYKLKLGPIDSNNLHAFVDWDLDFNGHLRSWSFGGAYAGEGQNPGWMPVLERKPRTASSLHTLQP